MMTLFDLVPASVLPRLPRLLLNKMAQVVHVDSMPTFASIAEEQGNPLLGMLVLDRTIGREFSKFSFFKQLAWHERGDIPSRMAALVYAHAGYGTVEDGVAVCQWAVRPESSPKPTRDQMQAALLWFCPHSLSGQQVLLDGAPGEIEYWRRLCVSEWCVDGMAGVRWRESSATRELITAVGGDTGRAMVQEATAWTCNLCVLGSSTRAKLRSLTDYQWELLLGLVVDENGVVRGERNDETVILNAVETVEAL